MTPDDCDLLGPALSAAFRVMGKTPDVDPHTLALDKLPAVARYIWAASSAQVAKRRDYVIDLVEAWYSG